MMIIRYTVRAASHSTYRTPPKRKPPMKLSNSPGSTAEVWLPVVCCLAVIIFVTVVMLTCPMTP